MHRYTDIESTPKRLPPAYGYLTHQLLPLQKALEPIASQIDQLHRFSKIAKNECHFPSEHELTRDESAAVFLYTMEWGENSFYQMINRALRAEDRSTLKPWFAYLKLFDTAINKLPTIRKNLWRGVARNIAKNYKKGDEFTWWTISSCSTSVNIIKNFLGPNSTLFLIEAVNGKDVSKYTNYPNEDEVILCPGTRFRVLSDPLDQPPMHLVHLQEVTDDTEEELETSFGAMAMTSSSKTPTNHKTLNVQSLPMQIHTDQSGNRYEGEMKDGKKHGKGKMDFASGSTYIGIWVNDVRTGQGCYVWPNGDRYEGQFKDDKRHGKGKMDFTCGTKYTGDWVEDKRNGKGTQIWGPDTKWAGDTYTGDWVDDVRTGQGVYIYADGNRYEGQFKDYKRHGKGKMDFANGDKYTGDFVDDAVTGQGVYIYANGDRYEGQFKDDKRNGKGKMDFTCGTKYIGDWVEGKRNGKGTQIWGPGNKSAGDTYTGEWVDDTITGQGCFVWSNGNRYEGQFKDDKEHGKGTIIWGTNTKWAGDKYTGDWVDGVRTGQGVYIYANGDRYEGQWRNTNMDGKGKMNYANGTVQDGMWSNGSFIG